MDLKAGGQANAVTLTPGISMAETKTTLTFPAQDGLYYLVAEASAAVTYPTSTAEALNSGWIRKVGTGNYTWQNLNWNRSYAVYELNLTGPTGNRKLGEAATVKGLAGGSLSFDETGLLSGRTVQLLFQNATTEEGTWSWSYAPAADGPWTAMDGASGSSLSLDDSMIGNYLKAVFTANGDYEGTLEYRSSRPVAALMTEVLITGAAQIGNSLTAEVAPAACEAGVQYIWFRKDPTGTSDSLIYRGKVYTISQEDIGRQLYVKAEAITGSVAAGDTVTSSLTGEVLTAEWPEVTAVPLITAATDTTLTVRMPDGSTGLYQFSYSTSPAGSYQEAETKARDTAPAVITDLQPSTHYYIKVRRAAEKGFQDSPWSASWLAEGTTERPSVKGELTLDGEPVYGGTLTVAAPPPWQVRQENSTGTA